MMGSNMSGTSMMQGSQSSNMGTNMSNTGGFQGLAKYEKQTKPKNDLFKAFGNLG